MYKLKLKNGTEKEITADGFCEGVGHIVGGVEYDNFGHIVNSFTFIQVTEYANQLQWKHKNGKQRVVLLTLDGKTVRGHYEIV